MARPAKGLELAVEAYEKGELDRAARLVRKEHLHAAKRLDDETLVEVANVQAQMRGHLNGDALERFDAIVATGHAPKARADKVDVSPLGLWLAVAGSAAVLIAVFLPEASVASFSSIENNTLIQSGDGWFFIALALSGLFAVYRAYRSRRRTWWPLIAAAITIGLAIYDGRASNLRYCSVITTTLCYSGSPSIGLYLAGVGGGLLGIGGWQLRKGGAARAATASSPPARPGRPDVTGDAARFCGRCGTAFSRDDSFCPGCGTARPSLQT